MFLKGGREGFGEGEQALFQTWPFQGTEGAGGPDGKFSGVGA